MVVVSHLVVIYCIRIVLVADIFVVFRKRNFSKTNYKNALYLTRFHVIWNPFENPHGIPTDPWEFIIVPIPIPHPYPWEFPYPRQPWGDLGSTFEILAQFSWITACDFCLL